MASGDTINAAFEFYIQDFLADVPARWTDADKWRYLVLLTHLWHHGYVLDDDYEIVSKAGVKPRGSYPFIASKLRQSLCFHPDKEGALTQKRVHADRCKYLEKRDKSRERLDTYRGVKRVSKNVETVPPTPTPTPTSSKILTSADIMGMSWQDVGEHVVELMGIDPTRWTGNYAIVKTWLERGYDHGLDIYPTVRDVMERRQGDPPNSLRYFDAAIREAYEQRKLDVEAGDTIRRDPNALGGVVATLDHLKRRRIYGETPDGGAYKPPSDRGGVGHWSPPLHESNTEPD